MKKLLLVAVLLVVVGGVGFFFLSDSYNQPQSQDVTIGEPQSYIPTTSGREVPDGQKEYYNKQYGFSLLYPQKYSVNEYPEGDGSMTVTFEYVDDSIASGFQIFIVPFTEEQITEERFRTDVPSGVRESLKDVTIDGATGATFFSENDTLGATAEVWFIHGGHLYEVTTFRELAPWLSKIMATWIFE